MSEFNISSITNKPYIINGSSVDCDTLQFHAFIDGTSYDDAIEQFIALCPHEVNCINVDIMHHADVESYTNGSVDVTHFVSSKDWMLEDADYIAFVNDMIECILIRGVLPESRLYMLDDMDEKSALKFVREELYERLIDDSYPHSEVWSMAKSLMDMEVEQEDMEREMNQCDHDSPQWHLHLDMAADHYSDCAELADDLRRELAL